MIVFTKNGRAIRIKSEQFPFQNRGGVGIRAITLREDDEVVAVIQEENDNNKEN